MIKNFFKFWLGSFIFSSLIFSQKIDVKDTVRTTILQEFNAPSFGALILSNITRIESISSELLNKDGQKIKDGKGNTQKPKKEDFSKYVKEGRGTTVMVLFHESVDQAGTYYIKANLKGTAEQGALNATLHYLVIADYPTIANPFTIRKDYYYSENQSFSFAMLEYSDVNSYSYKIQDAGGAILDQGKGPIVSLEKVLNTIDNVGKQVVVKGFYRDKEITYRDPISKEVKKANWEFNIKRLDINPFSGWAAVDKTQKEQETKWEISVYNEFSKTFLFGYLAKTPSGFVFVPPEIKNLQVRSDPEGFSNSGIVSKFGAFPTVIINVNEEFMNTIPVGEGEDIKLTISFRTQFETIKKEFRATVIR